MPIDPARVRAILFDIDGTLRDTDDELVAKLMRVLRKPLGRERAMRVARRMVVALESATRTVLGLADHVQLDGPLNRVIDYLAPHGRTLAVPGVVEMIDLLHGRYRLGIVSAGPRRSAHRFLAEHDLARRMDIVVVGNTYRHTKPHPMPIIEATAVLGIPPHAALMVGDTTVDVESGRRAGAQTLAVLSGFGRRKDLDHANADDIADTAAILPRILGHVGGVNSD